jgi:SPP1 family predicted phage head-tail adaptor
VSELAGALRERVILQRRAEARDGLGGATGGWVSLGSAWAAIDYERAGPGVIAGALDDAPLWRVTMRVRGDVSAGDRLLWGERVLRVRRVERDPRTRDFLRLRAEEAR